MPMKEPKKQFLKRKKSEKRAQAEKQVRIAYKQTINYEEYEDEEEFGERTPIKGFKLNNKFYKWRIRMEPEIEDLYSTIDISKALNIPRERLRDWMVRGFIKPSLPSTSKGTIAIFIRTDVVCVALFMKLITKGFKRDAAAEYVELLIEKPGLTNSINFIILKSVVRNSDLEVASFFSYGTNPLNLHIDKDRNVNTSFTDRIIEADEWDDIQIINVVNIIKEVDAALAQLG
jgi:hypothetical protein